MASNDYCRPPGTPKRQAIMYLLAGYRFLLVSDEVEIQMCNKNRIENRVSTYKVEVSTFVG